MNPDPNPNPNPNRDNPNNLLDTIILLGYYVRIGCSFYHPTKFYCHDLRSSHTLIICTRLLEFSQHVQNKTLNKVGNILFPILSLFLCLSTTRNIVADTKFLFPGNKLSLSPNRFKTRFIAWITVISALIIFVITCFVSEILKDK